MTKIILIGCNGKMGLTVSSNIKNFKDLEIVAGVDAYGTKNENFPVFTNLETCTVQADVVLDFSRPSSLPSILNYSKKNKTHLVICTTGYDEVQLNSIKESSLTCPIFHSANMSLGINVINSVLKQISSLLFENFDIEIIEKHHNQKVDAPSGTALLLADTIKASISEETHYIKGRDGISKRDSNEIGIHSVRGGSIIGEHQVIFAGQGEVIELKHEAFSRDVFAIGALKACSFINGKTSGIYTMDDLIQEAVSHK